MAQKVEFLEDILKRYGVAADYWPLDESVPAAEEQADRDALWDDAVRAGADPRAELLAAIDEDRRAGTSLPLGVRLGDIRATNGQAVAALKAYQFAVFEEDDPARLCGLGYLLLQRCRVDELPLCDKDFDGATVDFPGGEAVSISCCRVDFGDPGPEFPHKPGLLHPAIRAFGKAYVRCVQRFLGEIGWPGGDKWHDASEFLERMAAAEDKWHELVALDGLRAAFMQMDDLDGLESVIGAYYGWVEDYEEASPGLHALASQIAKQRGATLLVEGKFEPDRESPFYDFEVNFSKVEPWLRARRKAPPVRPDALRPRDLRAAEDSLRREHGDRYLQLPREVRWLLREAQLQQFLLGGTDADWAAVANWYGRAVETLLRRALGGKLDAQGLHNRFNDGHPYARAAIRDFVRLFELPQFAQLGPLMRISQADASLMAQLAPDLETVAKTYRNPAVHGDERTLPARALKLRALVLGVEGQSALLWRIASLCDAD